MAIVLASKPGLSSATTLSIPKEWDATWFRNLINNQLKGADVRNAVGSGGIKVTGSIASPYATIGFGAPVSLPGPVTILTPATAAASLTINVAFNSSQPGLLIKAVDGSAAFVIDTQSATTGSFISYRNSGVERGFIGTGPVCLAGAALADFSIVTDTAALRLQGFTGAFITPGSAVTALTVTGFSNTTFVSSLIAGSANMTNALLFLSGGSSSAGIETIRMDHCASTGTGTATFTATNKPTATAGGPVSWIPINLDGVRRYIPVWA